MKLRFAKTKEEIDTTFDKWINEDAGTAAEFIAESTGEVVEIIED